MTRNFTYINSERGQDKRTQEIIQKAISYEESRFYGQNLFTYSGLTWLYSMKQASRPHAQPKEKKEGMKGARDTFLAWLP
jgi:hypothetical protein